MQDSIHLQIKNLFPVLKCLIPAGMIYENRLQSKGCTRQPWEVTQKPSSDPKSQGLLHVLYQRVFLTYLAGESHEVCRVLLEKEVQGKWWSQREHYYSRLGFFYEGTMNCRCSSWWLSPLQRKRGGRISRNEYLAEILSPEPWCLHSNDALIVTTRACSAKIPGLLLYELVQTLGDLDIK